MIAAADTLAPPPVTFPAVSIPVGRAWEIASRLRPVEPRTWALRGWVAIHACDAERPDELAEGATTPGQLIGIASFGPLTLGAELPSRWRVPGMHLSQVTNFRPLADWLPYAGHAGLWHVGGIEAGVLIRLRDVGRLDWRPPPDEEPAPAPARAARRR